MTEQIGSKRWNAILQIAVEGYLKDLYLKL